MPNAAPKPCGHIGCWWLWILCGAPGRPQASGVRKASLQSPRTWLRQRVEKVRKPILCRDKGLYQTFLHVGRVGPAKQVNHIHAKFEGESDDDDNLQAICIAYHRARYGVGGSNLWPSSSQGPAQ
jgi:5-methylcytosine-specific restriction endonuclease McrA